MEREIEVKLLGMDIEVFEQTLINKNAEKILDEEQQNIVINSTAHKIEKAQGYLRIRRTKNMDTGEEKAYFTFKEQVTSEGIRENIEHTTEISSVSDLQNILRLIGYDIQEGGKKLRRSYKYNGARFDIDVWDKAVYPYPYVEVETTSKEKLYAILEELGIEKTHISTKSISELQEELKK